MVRVVRQPHGSVDGIALESYRLGQTYELTPLLADYLVLQGYAEIEMRRRDRSSRQRSTDRRRPRDWRS